ncbi:MAG: CopG family transcriptional regulator [Cyanobacteria bacterium HKST-UBA01]|nr:CopG family transcriptional regulator [Cyanobacteria bacterium HKST-UBA01]
MSAKKVLIALPNKMLEEIDALATTEHRTRSDLIREALRRYLANANLINRAAIVPPVSNSDYMNGGTYGG